MEKSKHLQDRLQELKSEIEVLKVEEKQTHLDRLHEENVQQGNNKYSTLKKVRSTTSHVHFFIFYFTLLFTLLSLIKLMIL